MRSDVIGVFGSDTLCSYTFSLKLLLLYLCITYTVTSICNDVPSSLGRGVQASLMLFSKVES